MAKPNGLPPDRSPRFTSLFMQIPADRRLASYAIWPGAYVGRVGGDGRNFVNHLELGPRISWHGVVTPKAPSAHCGT